MKILSTQKKVIPAMIVGIELKSSCPRGIRNRLTDWLKLKCERELIKSVHLLDKENYLIWDEYFAPLVRKYGREFSYQIIVDESRHTCSEN